MKNFNIHYFALLRDETGISQENFSSEAENGSELFSELKQKYQLSLSIDHIQVAINDEYCPLDSKITDGDKIVFIPPVAGG